MKTYGLLLRRHYEYGNERVEAYVVCREAGADYPKGCSSDGENQYDKEVPKHLHGLLLDGLGMYGFVTDVIEPCFIGNEVEFRNVFAIDMPKANRLSRTMKRVLNRISKDEAHEAGDRLVSLAKALKLSFVVEQIGKPRSGTYGENDWRFMSIPLGRDRYRQLITDAVNAERERRGLAAA